MVFHVGKIMTIFNSYVSHLPEGQSLSQHYRIVGGTDGTMNNRGIDVGKNHWDLRLQ